MVSLLSDPRRIEEGPGIPANAVSRGIVDRSRAVWLIPTRDFQLAILAAQVTAPGPAPVPPSLGNDRVRGEPTWRADVDR